MKIGDKVICIKSCICDIDALKGTVLNTKGKIYLIDKIERTNIIVTCDIELAVCTYPIEKDEFKFNKYFSTLKELRKQKIKKLNSL